MKAQSDSPGPRRAEPQPQGRNSESNTYEAAGLASNRGAQSNDAQSTVAREFEGRTRIVILTLSALMATLQVYLILFALVSPIQHLSLFIACVIPATFLYYKPARKLTHEQIPWYDWTLAAISSAPFTYVFVDYEQIINRAISPTILDQGMALIAVVVTIEATRRCIGLILPSIAIVFLVYTFAGPYLPGILGHRGYDWERVTNTLFMTTNGLFSSPSRVAATMVFMFVLFGAFLQATGASKVITDAALAMTGRFTGGPAKVAVIASGALGTVSGSASANVATSGPVSIPLMKSIGYKRVFAGAVESAASTAGTLTPPIMGAAAFVMAEITGTPYVEIVVAGIIPALLFYASVLLIVHLEAARMGLQGIPRDQIPRLRRVMKTGWVILMPVVLLAVLIFMYVPVTRAAFFAIVALLAVGVLHPQVRMRVKSTVEVLASSIPMVLQAAAACICAGLVIGTLNLTGLGLRFSSWILSLSGTSIILALIFTMVVTIILGMGLPPVAAYIVSAAITAPALIDAGFDVIPSHFFIFYFSCLASITPPVGVAAFIAAGISGARPMRTAAVACFLAFPTFILPFLFMFSPEYLGVGTLPEVIWMGVKAVIGFSAIAIGVVGFWRTRLTLLERGLAVIGGSLFLFESILIILGGLFAIASFVTTHMLRSKNVSPGDPASAINDRETQ